MTRSAAVYLRVSSAGQAEDGAYGLAAQESACQGYAARAGLEVQQVYRDVITGTREQRQAFQQLLSDAGRYQSVIVSSLDRLARTVPIAYGLAGALAEAGLELHSTLEGPVSFEDDSNSLMFGISAVLFDAERRKITRRVMGGKLAKVRAGKPLNKLRAYGWKNDQVEPTEAAWVQ